MPASPGANLDPAESLEELAVLAESAGALIVDRITQARPGSIPPPSWARVKCRKSNHALKQIPLKP